MASASGTLTSLARSVLEQAEALERHLVSASLPQPSLSQDSPIRYPSAPSHPEIFATRMSLIDSLNTLLPLVQGPAEYLRTLTGPTKTNVVILRTVIEHRLHEAVPSTGTISIADLSSKTAIPIPVLNRLLAHAFTFNLFLQPSSGQIEHSALSKSIALIEPWVNLITAHPMWSALDQFPSAVATKPSQSSATTFARKGSLREISIRNDIGATTQQQSVPFELAHSAKFFDYLNSKSLLPSFTAAMVSHARFSDSVNNEHVLGLFPWSSVSSGTVIDLGGGSGHATIAVAKSFSDIKVIVQDVASNKSVCAKTIEEAELTDRVIFAEQDFFSAQPKDLVDGGTIKAIFLRAIIHDWPDAQGATILSHLIPYMKHGAKVFVMDRVVPMAGDEKEDGFELSKHEMSHLTHMDLTMFTFLGSKESTKIDFEDLCGLVNRGLQGSRVVVEGVKRLRGSEMGGVVLGMTWCDRQEAELDSPTSN